MKDQFLTTLGENVVRASKVEPIRELRRLLRLTDQPVDGQREPPTSWWRSTDVPRPCASTTGPNSPPRALWTGARRGEPLHPAGPARSERLHRALQSELSDGGPQRASLRVGGPATGADRHLVADLQQRTKPRQPWPAAAAHVAAEAFVSRPLSLGSVYLTAKPTSWRTSHPTAVIRVRQRQAPRSVVCAPPTVPRRVNLEHVLRRVQPDCGHLDG